MRKAIYILAALSWLTMAASAHAVTIFTDRTAWEAVVSGVSTETFDTTIADANSITLDNGIVSTINPSLLASGLNIVTSGEYAGRVGTLVNNHPPTITWTFPSAVIAFFGDFVSLNPNGLTVTGDFDGTGVTTIGPIRQIVGMSSGGFGIIGGATFTAFNWGTNDSSELFTIDNFSQASSVVPEPSTFLLLGSGLAGLAGWRRRKNRVATS